MPRSPAAKSPAGKIEQHLLQLVASQLVGDGADVVLVGEQKLDGLKSGRLGACEAFQKWMLREEHRQIGRELGHLASSTTGIGRTGRILVGTRIAVNRKRWQFGRAHSEPIGRWPRNVCVETIKDWLQSGKQKPFSVIWRHGVAGQLAKGGEFGEEVYHCLRHASPSPPFGAFPDCSMSGC